MTNAVADIVIGIFENIAASLVIELALRWVRQRIAQMQENP